MPAPTSGGTPRTVAPTDLDAFSRASTLPDPALSSRIPCGRCGEPLMPGTTPCTRCGVADPATAEPAAPRKQFFGAVRLPTLPLAVALVGGAAVGILSLYTASVKDTERRNRIWDALGATASEERVQAVEQEAREIGVSTDVLVRIRLACLHRELHRPPTFVLREARLSADRNGKDPEVEVLEVARAACKER